MSNKPSLEWAAAKRPGAKGLVSMSATWFLVEIGSSRIKPSYSQLFEEAADPPARVVMLSFVVVLKALIPRGLRRDILKEVSQGATKIPSRTWVVLLRKRKGKSVFD
ncbi:hypothetical protein PIB30_047720 [Stylosanthes scabra]|uniref:Uncharacterized protein n=1 Tax=Stylosanthes scabra TaxID=79078 RepID=A0ABU6UG66_9FABA|nr:hypothetical protein [Stylosanthes scabra]